MVRRRDSRGLYLPSEKNYDTILGFESVKNWDMYLRSPRTKDTYFRNLYHLLEWVETKRRGIESPDDLLKLSDSEAVDLIRRFSHHYDVKGNVAMAQLCKTILKSFYRANVRELTSPLLKMHKVPKTQKTYNRIIPTKDEVYALADSTTSLRNRALLLTLWQSGLRCNTLSNLTIGHVKQGLLKNEVPLKIDINPNIDKTSLQEPYFTFIDIDAIDALKKYLKTRGKLEDLDEDESLFLSNIGEGRKITEMAMLRVVKRTAKRAGIDPKRIWVHCFRASFYNMLVGRCDDTIREFLFGHRLQGSRANYFAPIWIEKIREAYMKAGWSRSRIVLSKEDVRAEVVRALMGKIGDEELAPIAEKLRITPQQIRMMIRRIRGEGAEEETEVLLETERIERGLGNSNHYESRIITEDELCIYLDEGWDLIKELSNGKIVVRKPNLNS